VTGGPGPAAPSRCRSCGAAILWRKTGAGRLMPVDAEATAGGNVRLIGEFFAEVLGPLDAANARAAGESLHRSHFATCSDGPSHRRPRS